jgi:hypothetical protein
VSLRDAVHAGGTGELHIVELKGISEPVEIVSVDWT